jgi:hypothetical protein
MPSTYTETRRKYYLANRELVLERNKAWNTFNYEYRQQYFKDRYKRIKEEKEKKLIKEQEAFNNRFIVSFNN